MTIGGKYYLFKGEATSLISRTTHVYVQHIPSALLSGNPDVTIECEKISRTGVQSPSQVHVWTLQPKAYNLRWVSQSNQSVAPPLPLPKSLQQHKEGKRKKNVSLFEFWVCTALCLVLRGCSWWSFWVMTKPMPLAWNQTHASCMQSMGSDR